MFRDGTHEIRSFATSEQLNEQNATLSTGPDIFETEGTMLSTFRRKISVPRMSTVAKKTMHIPVVLRGTSKGPGR